MASCNVFVTVGTTKFDRLIFTVTSRPVLDVSLLLTMNIILKLMHGKGLLICTIF